MVMPQASRAKGADRMDEEPVVVGKANAPGRPWETKRRRTRFYSRRSSAGALRGARRSPRGWRRYPRRGALQAPPPAGRGLPRARGRRVGPGRRRSKVRPGGLGRLRAWRRRPLLREHRRFGAAPRLRPGGGLFRGRRVRLRGLSRYPLGATLLGNARMANKKSRTCDPLTPITFRAAAAA